MTRYSFTFARRDNARAPTVVKCEPGSWATSDRIAAYAVAAASVALDCGQADLLLTEARRDTPGEKEIVFLKPLTS